MLVEDVELATGAMPLKVDAAAQRSGFVHSDVDAAGAQGAAHGVKHLPDQLVGLGLAHEEHGFVVLDGLVIRPAADLFEVRQRLDAADQFNAETGGIGIQLAQFRLTIAAALVAEARFPGNLVGVLGVEHCLVLAEHRQVAEPALDLLDAHHRIAAAIEHHSKSSPHEQFVSWKIKYEGEVELWLDQMALVPKS
jgi:hypothetical protein